MVGVNGRSIIENELALHSLPAWTTSGLDHWSQAVGEQRPPLAQVDDVEDDTLVALRVSQVRREFFKLFINKTIVPNLNY